MHQKFHRLFHLHIPTLGQSSWIIRDEYAGLYLDLLQELPVGISKADFRDPKKQRRIDLPFPPDRGSCARNGHSHKLADI